MGGTGKMHARNALTARKGHIPAPEALALELAFREQWLKSEPLNFSVEEHRGHKKSVLFSDNTLRIQGGKTALSHSDLVRGGLLL